MRPVVLFALVLGVSGLAMGVPTAAPTGEESPFEWASPETFAGDVALRFLVTPAAGDTCTFDLRIKQHPLHDALLGYVWWGDHWLAWTRGELVQLHHGATDTRAVFNTTDGGYGALDLHAPIARDGPQTLGLAVHHAAHLTDGDVSRPGIFVQIDCPAGGTATLDAADPAPELFTDQDLNGTGVSSQWSAYTGLYVAAARHTFAMEMPAEIHMHDWAGSGWYRLEGPDAHHAGTLPESLRVDGPAGTYRLGLERVGSLPVLGTAVSWHGPEAAPG